MLPEAQNRLAKLLSNPCQRTGFDTQTGMRQFCLMVDWIRMDELAPYPETVAQMEAHVSAMIAGVESEHIWLLEHPPLYTAGTSSDAKDLMDPKQFPVFETKRGGQYTYHGPGQRVAYTMLDLNTRGRDVRKFVWTLEEWIIQTLAEFNVKGERRGGRVGVWVVRDDKPLSALGTPVEDKIAAIGVRLRRWHSFHGICINVDPDLTHYAGIVPCGIAEHGVTSLVDLGLPVTMGDLDLALRKTFDVVF